MKYTILIALLCLAFCTLNADEWKITTDMSFTLSQNTYSDNWQGEERGNITWVLNSHTRANKKLSELFMWRNNLRLAFGQTHQQDEDDQGRKKWGKPDKSTDRIDLQSVLTVTFNQYVDPFFAVRWQSQFIDIKEDDSDIPVNPMRFTESAGIARNFIEAENHNLSSRLGAAFRQKYDRTDYPDSPEIDALTYDGGIELVTEYNRRLEKHGVNIDSKLLLYQALYNSAADDDEEDYWKALDITWENSLTTKLFSIVNIVFNFDLIYDKEEHRKGQFRQHLGIGVAWQL